MCEVNNTRLSPCIRLKCEIDAKLSEFLNEMLQRETSMKNLSIYIDNFSQVYFKDSEKKGIYIIYSRS